MDFTFIDRTVVFFEDLSRHGEPVVNWFQVHWMVIVLTAEIVGAVITIKYANYRRGIGWLAAALATIWLGGVV